MTQDQMEASYLPTLLQIRLLVGFLGERTQFAWWPTAFYPAYSRSFLEPVFARTTPLAQYHGVSTAARLLHDQHLNLGSYHLFRLPEEFEQDLHNLMGTSTGAELARQIPAGGPEALAALQNLATLPASSGSGPVAVGKIADLETTEIWRTAAGFYWSAFTHKTQIYPYLLGKP